MEDTPEARRTAWARMSLLVLYFNPSGMQAGCCLVHSCNVFD